MRRHLSPLARDLRTVVVTLVVAMLCLSAPAVAKLVNADTVDGKSAVGAAAPIKKRAGKLVATNAGGYLPNNIVKRAPDAAKLGGKPASTYETHLAPRGSVQTGVYQAAGVTGGYLMATVDFAQRLPAAIDVTRVDTIPAGGPYTTSCPGPGKVVPNGYLCIYEHSAINATFNGGSLDAATGQGGVNPAGFGIFFNTSGSGSAYSYGDWAVRAG